MSVVTYHGDTCTAGCNGGRCSPSTAHTTLCALGEGECWWHGLPHHPALNPDDKTHPTMRFCCLHPLPDSAQGLQAASITGRSMLCGCPDGSFPAASMMLWHRWPHSEHRSGAGPGRRPVLGCRRGLCVAWLVDAGAGTQAGSLHAEMWCSPLCPVLWATGQSHPDPLLVGK